MISLFFLLPGMVFGSQTMTQVGGKVTSSYSTAGVNKQLQYQTQISTNITYQEISTDNKIKVSSGQIPGQQKIPPVAYCPASGYLSFGGSVWSCGSTPIIAHPEQIPEEKKCECKPGVAEIKLKFIFSADALFDFDKYYIRSEGKQKLDSFVSDLKELTWEKMTITGHTDRFGSEQYNLKLSKNRAESVKNYLVNAGIDSDKIIATWKGESEPITLPNQCPGKIATKGVKACLQPDRRVDIEVDGAKTITKEIVIPIRVE